MVSRLVLLMIGLAMGGSLKAGGLGDGGFKKSHPQAALEAATRQDQHDSMFVLDADSFRHHVDLFNTMEPENIVNYTSNDKSWQWLRENIPFFECPDKDFERIYYFRWWTFRKHLKQTPDGFVFADGRKVTGSDDLTRVTGELP